MQQLQRTVGNANLGSLLALRGEVAATATNASNLAHQAVSTAVNSSAAHGHMTPAERARANIEALHHDLFEKRVLDPYLQFNSPEEEEAYRKREAERDEARKRALALNTPEGDRRAAELALEQLHDAGSHGADRSPDFLRMVVAPASAPLSVGHISSGCPRPLRAIRDWNAIAICPPPLAWLPACAVLRSVGETP